MLLTGATGFVGKVLVEKLLRSLPTIDRCYLNRAVVLNINLGSRHFADFTDDLSTRTNNLANLISRNRHRSDSRRIIRYALSSCIDCSFHFTEDMHTAIPCLAQGNLHDFFSD